MIVWRIAVEAPAYPADDLSGAGAKATGGRWNRPGNPVVYASTSIALACLETLVHLNPHGLPLNRYLVRLDIPEALWRARQTLTHTSAPVGWDALPTGITSLELGDQWLKTQACALLQVPSIVVPEEHHVLINPAHPGVKHIQASKLRRWTYDARLGEG